MIHEQQLTCRLNKQAPPLILWLCLIDVQQHNVAQALFAAIDYNRLTFKYCKLITQWDTKNALVGDHKQLEHPTDNTKTVIRRTKLKCGSLCNSNTILFMPPSKHKDLCESWSQSAGSDGMLITLFHWLRRCHLEVRRVDWHWRMSDIHGCTTQGVCGTMTAYQPLGMSHDPQ